jgi:hypothetical protein
MSLQTINEVLIIVAFLGMIGIMFMGSVTMIKDIKNNKNKYTNSLKGYDKPLLIFYKEV